MDGQNGASRGQSKKDPAGAAKPRMDGPAPFARLKKRSEFLAVAKGARMHEAAFTLQAIVDESRAKPARRFGLTVTKKTGNSVERNRIRRRLREALRLNETMRGEMAGGQARDYVVVARRDVLSRGFDLLKADLARAVERIDRRMEQRDRRATTK